VSGLHDSTCKIRRQVASFLIPGRLIDAGTRVGLTQRGASQFLSSFTRIDRNLQLQRAPRCNSDLPRHYFVRKFGRADIVARALQIREDLMLIRVLIACSAFALIQTEALANSQFLGKITMYLCDGGEDLCSNTVSSSPVNLPSGPFTEDFVFDLVNNFPDVPNNFPLVRAAVLDTSIAEDFSSATVMLYDPSGDAIGLNTPFGTGGSQSQATAEDNFFSGTGYYVEVTGVSNIDNLPLDVSVNAFDLGGPAGLPEPSTWAMMLLGLAGLGFAARRRRSALVLRRAPHNPAAPHNLPRFLS
jgi:hypothetical protein